MQVNGGALVDLQAPQDPQGIAAVPQCAQDCRKILKGHSRAIAVALVAGLAGALVCLLSTPAPHVVEQVMVGPDTVARWAGDPQTVGTALASGACPDGGRALPHKVLWWNATKEFRVACQEPRLSRRAYITLGITLVALALMLAGSPPDICMLMATMALLLWPWGPLGEEAGIISEKEAWQGFSNNGVLTVGALFVVAKAVDETGIVSLAMKRVLGRPKSLFVAQLRLLIPVAVSSAFMNNTPIVAMLIPVVESWAPSIGYDPAKFLMPLSFASMLGGMCSMMGTSTNLVVAGLLQKKEPGLEPFALFDIVPVGGPCCLLGILYMAVFSKCLLGNNKNHTSDGGQAGEGAEERTRPSYLVYFMLPPSGVFRPIDLGLAGQSLSGLEADGFALEGVLRFGQTPGGVRDISSSSKSSENTGSTGSNGKSHTTPTDGLSSGESLRSSVKRRGVWKPDNSTDWDTVEFDSSDILAVRCYAKELGSLRRSLARQGVKLISELPTLRGRTQGRRRNTRFLAEAVVGRSSPVIGIHRANLERLGEAMMGSYGASLIGIRDDASKTGTMPGPRQTRHARSVSSPGPRQTRHARSTSGPAGKSADTLEAALLFGGAQRPYVPHGFVSGSTRGGAESTASRVEVGDVLLVEVFPISLDHIASDFTLVTAVPGSRPPRYGSSMDRLRMYIAGTCLTLMVVLSATKIMSLLTAAIMAASVMLATKTITLKAAFAAIKGRTLLAIVVTFGVGTAFETTGLAHAIAGGLISVFGGLGPIGVLLSVSLVTTVVGCAVSNNAVVILMFPICQTLAAESGGAVTLRQLLVVLLVGASSSFLTPMSYQTNLMVFSPGNYKFSDYAKFGIGLQLSMVAASVVLAYFAKGFYPDVPIN